MLASITASITKESKSHSWDLSNWGIDKEKVSKEPPQIAQNFKETSEKSTINDTQKILEDIDEKIH